MHANHRVTFCGLVAAVLHVEPAWIELFKEKCDLNYIQELQTAPTVTVMGKWFKVNKVARTSASKLVSVLTFFVHLTRVQLGPLYEKLKTRLYNAQYHREKRLEAKYKGDVSKMRDDLGFEVPVRVKRRRKSKQQSTSTNENRGAEHVQQGSAIISETEPQTQAAKENASAQIGDHESSTGDSIAVNTLNQELRPEVTESANVNGTALSVTSGINSNNSVTGLASSAQDVVNSLVASEVSKFFSSESAGTNAAAPALNICKNMSCAWIWSFTFVCSEYWCSFKGEMQFVLPISNG